MNAKARLFTLPNSKIRKGSTQIFVKNEMNARDKQWRLKKENTHSEAAVGGRVARSSGVEEEILKKNFSAHRGEDDSRQP
jgi:hypothetical protein